MTSQPPFLPPEAAKRILQGDLALLQAGLSRGLRLDAAWPQWNMPLLHAIATFCPPQAPAMLSALLEAGCDPEARFQGLTAIMCAAGAFNQETGDPLGARLACIKVLLTAMPQPPVVALAHLAVRRGYRDLLEHLLERGCSPNAALENGHTLLHESYAYDQSDIGRFLISKGANEELRNHSGKVPRQCSRKQGPDREAQALDFGLPDLAPAAEGRALRL